MKTILVVDDMAVFREPIAASLRLAGYTTLCACDGEEALQMARERLPDIVLLDMSMPKMDGLTFLKHLRADSLVAATHVILLTALSEKKHVLAAASLGVRDYLLKSRFRLADLLERIKKHLPPPTACEAAPTTSPSPAGSALAAAAPAATQAAVRRPALGAESNPKIEQLMTREQFIEKLNGAMKAKTLCGVVAQVISIATSPRGEASQLASVIARDPVLSARVLQAANSAAYSSAGACVTTVRDAIRKVGFTTVRNVAAALGVFDSMPEASPDGFDPVRCWQHSFAVAQLCERLAAQRFPEEAGLAYVIGLCHDLGEIFVRTQFGKEYQQLMDAVTRTGQPIEKLHREMFGLTRAEMVSTVCECMSLPDTIRAPINILHSSDAARTNDSLARILWMAENYANGAMLSSGPASRVAPLSRSFCQVAVGEGHPLKPDAKALRSEVLALTLTLAQASRAEEAKLLTPMFELQPCNVWIARDPAMSDFDPISVALESMAKGVTVERRLPVGDEADQVDALVIVSPSEGTANISSMEIEQLVSARERASRSLPLLAIASETSKMTREGSIHWRSVVSLSELAAITAVLPVSAAK